MEIDKLTQAQLKEELTYNPHTGDFTWIKAKKKRDLTKPAGCETDKGYVLIGLNGRLYSAHRLAFLYMVGSFPPLETATGEEVQVDHINGKSNRWANLRLATRSQNLRNQGASGASGYKGVYRNGKNWTARVYVDGRLVTLGTFKSVLDAALEVDRANLSYFGEFACLNFGKAAA